MRRVEDFGEIFLYRKFADFRKSINGLSLIVESELALRPFSGALFVFISRRRDSVKILWWDQTGFALWYKRLETAKFSWPRGPIQNQVVRLTPEQLEWLLSGVDIWKMKRHEVIEYEKMG